jgi:ferredoxin/polyferredoxin
MTIIATRRISQFFFLALFLWFCLVMTVGDAWYQMRGWPVNWLIQLDPLAAIGTLLATGALHPGLLWSTLTLSMTLLVGRFFCAWICPFGTLHHLVGHLAFRGRPLKQKIRAHTYHPGQRVKYWLLIVLLAAAGADICWWLLMTPARNLTLFIGLLLLAALFGGILAARKHLSLSVKQTLATAGVVGGWVAWSMNTGSGITAAASLQIGLLDPLPFMYRSINLVIIPLVQGGAGQPRLYDGALLLALCFFSAVGMNLIVPRFYCRFVCPLGALFGLLSRTAFWRIGKRTPTCVGCLQCEAACQGASSPATTIRGSECLLCMNCRPSCGDQLLQYSATPSAAGEVLLPDISRRHFTLSLALGLSSVPLIHLEGVMGSNWNPALVRPPGSLAESHFSKRCLKCGQCIRICPTNVIQTAGIDMGLENLWTPVLNFRIGTSGCQLNCIACGHVCPTGAISPLDLDRKLGRGAHSTAGPIKIGTAFIDRGRCLPWAMHRPCIVCQENCPVSPKAIQTRPVFSPLPDLPPLTVTHVSGNIITVTGASLSPDRLSTGDYFCSIGREAAEPVLIVGNTDQTLTVAPSDTIEPPTTTTRITVVIRLQQPYVDPAACIGCGTCEHECPVRGLRAIRVSAENETRETDHALLA